MSTTVSLRPGSPTDANTCAEICFKAFTAIAQTHNFPPDFPTVDVAVGLMKMLLSRPDIYSVIAEADGRIIGSNFSWESDMIAGIGPITVDPTIQNRGVGRQLMQNVLERAAQRKLPGVRLVQATYHNRSLSLYTKLGFEVREPLAVVQGTPLKMNLAGCSVSSATESDVAACEQLCRKVHGHDRNQELLGAITQKTATVVERNGCVSGYSTGVGFFGHTVAETNEDLKALIAAASEFAGPGFLLPTRNTEVFRWCLGHGLRVTQPLTLMSLGLYNKPRGAFMPSILF